MKYKVIFFLFGAAYLAVLILSRFPITLNLSTSVPVGFYWMKDDPSLPYMQFCMSPEEKSIATEHGIAIDGGKCPDGTKWVIKPNMQGEHDIVYTAAGIAVDGKLLPNTKPVPRDHAGRPLEHYPFGHYRTSETETWAISSFSDRSFDSRYFGPIKRGDIVSYARPILTTR